MTGHQGKANRKRWSFADEAQFRLLKQQGKSHDAIAAYFSTPTLVLSAHAITAKWGNMNRPPAPTHRPSGKTDGQQGIYHRSGEIWSAAENAELRRRVIAGQNFLDIGRAFQRGPWSCRQQDYELRVAAGEILPAQMTRAASQKTAREARDRAIAAAKAKTALARDPIRELLGEPAPGRSALDRIKAGLVEPPAWMDGRALRFVPKITLATLPWHTASGEARRSEAG